MKKSKLTFVFIVIAVFLLCFGVVAYFLAPMNKGLGTDFDRGDDNVFVKVNATYTGPALKDENASATYDYAIEKGQQGAYDKKDSTLPYWNLGETLFTLENTQIVLYYEIENLNDMNGLSVKFESIGIDPQENILTEYKYAFTKQEFDLEQNTKLTESSLDEIKLNKATESKENSKLFLSLTYTLKNFDKNVDMPNSLFVFFKTVETNA